MHGTFKRARAQTLFVKRPLVNADEFVAWAKSQGFKTTQDPKDLHITLAYSKTPLNWPAPAGGKITVPGTSQGRTVQPLGDKGAVVLKFASPELTKRWQSLKDAGAAWDYEGFQPHVTVSWKADGVDLSGVTPYAGPLVFGPEVFKPVNPDWSPKVEKRIAILKSDGDQRIAWGWASVAALNGEPVVDLQKDVIDGEEMMKATTEFMEDVRRLQSMHAGEQIGVVVHSLPLTNELAKAFGLNTDREGWIVGVKIHDDGVWKRVKDGELRAFSIGGSGEREIIKSDDEEDDEDEEDLDEDVENEDEDVVVDSKRLKKLDQRIRLLNLRECVLKLNKSFDESKHPRVPSGRSGGGEFTAIEHQVERSIAAAATRAAMRGGRRGGRGSHAVAHLAGHIAGHTAGHATREALTPEEKAKHRRSMRKR